MLDLLLFVFELILSSVVLFLLTFFPFFCFFNQRACGSIFNARGSLNFPDMALRGVSLI